MFKEKRPTCVSVIGWTWIIVGGWMLISSLLALIAFAFIFHQEPGGALSITERFAPYLAGIQLIVACLGIFSGIRFLSLEAWTRPVLEGLSWALLTFIVGFMIFWIIKWGTIVYDAGAGFSIVSLMGLFMGVMGCSAYGIPLGIMIRVLRGPKVRDAMKPRAEQGD